MDELASLIQTTLIKRKQTLCLAESCTGGALAARLTLLAGCSNYFLGSIVAYSNQMKIDVLGVDEKTLQMFGAVSQPVVEQMAKGALRLADSDYSVAISGIAGPDGGTAAKPVGTIWAAIGRRGGEVAAWPSHFSGSRQEIIEKTVQELLVRLLRAVSS